MHELSLAASVLQIVEDAARREAFTRVQRLRLAVPVFAGVEVAALRFALEAVAPGTLLDGAELVLDETAAAARCLDCGLAFEATSATAPCPQCGGAAWQAAPGTDTLRVVDLLVG